MIKLPRRFANYALAVATGCLMVLMFPGWDLVWLAPFALTPLLIALWREPRPFYRFLLGYVAGNIYWFGLCPWIEFVLEVHGGMGRWGGWGTFVVFLLIKSIHFGLFGLLCPIVMKRWYAVPAVAALWTAIERTNGDFGFAWLCLGNALIDLEVPLRLAPWTGVYGLSFVVVMTATTTALALLRRPRQQLVWLLAVPLMVFLPPLPAHEAGSEQAVMVQPNVPEEETWTVDLTLQLHQSLLSQSRKGGPGAHPRLIIWPEVPGPIYYFRDAALQAQIGELALGSRASVLAGTVAENASREPLNSAFLVSAEGRLVDRYDKINLVPFGEYVPPVFSWVNRISHEAGDFVPGSRMVIFPLGDEKLGAFICYEAAFPDQVRRFVRGGATVLANLSNDGYFGHSDARRQHLSIVRMRAAENRRWILRAANNGITANIDPAGQVRMRLPDYESASGVFDYSAVSELTVYSRLGDWFVWVCLAGSVMALLASQVPRYRPEQ